MKPQFRILADNQDITDKINDRLLSISITDERGIESDTAEIRLDDRDAQVQWPIKGAELQIWLGFESTGLVNKGTYVVDALAHDGPPDILTITARAADMRDSLKIRKTRSWHQKTIGQIVETIAAEHQLQPGVSEELASTTIPHIDQTDESDLNFLTRLSKNYDAITKPASGYLLFTNKNKAESATGKELPAITIDRTAGDTHNYTESGRVEYTGVKAWYNHNGEAKRKSVTVGNTQKLKVLPGTKPDEAQARSAGTAELQKLTRSNGKLSLTLSVGKPEIIAGGQIITTGYRPPINNTWLVASVTHTYNDNGLSSSLRCENKL